LALYRRDNAVVLPPLLITDLGHLGHVFQEVVIGENITLSSQDTVLLNTGIEVPFQGLPIQHELVFEVFQEIFSPEIELIVRSLPKDLQDGPEMTIGSHPGLPSHGPSCIGRGIFLN
jgi:hypothetical protein